MGEVSLPCFFISLPETIFVIGRLVGPFSEKLWPKFWKCCPRPAASGSIFKLEVTGPDPPCTFSSCSKLAQKWVCLLETLSFNRLTRRLQNRFISNYFVLFAFSSPVKFSVWLRELKSYPGCLAKIYKPMTKNNTFINYIYQLVWGPWNSEISINFPCRFLWLTRSSRVSFKYLKLGNIVQTLGNKAYSK